MRRAQSLLGHRDRVSKGAQEPRATPFVRLADRHRAARRVWSIHPSAPHHPGQCG